MDISLTGGSGFVGRTLARRLQARGHHVRLIRRPATAGNPPSGSNCDVREADFRDFRALSRAFAGSDAVIHLVGIIREHRDQTYEYVHDGITGTVLQAAQSAGVQRFVHMSALGSRAGARSRYHRSKWTAEERVRSSGLAWTIFRPSIIHGPDDEFTNLFARISAWSPVVPVMGAGRHLLQPVSVENVALAFEGAVANGASIGRTYDLCGNERLSFDALLRAILAATRRRRWLLHLPMPLARFQARCLEWIFPAVLRRPAPLNRDQLLMLDEDNTGDGTEADREFGLVHEPFQRAMERQFGGNPR